MAVTRFVNAVVSFVIGAAILTLLSALQKIIAGYPLVLKGFYIPFIYGGVVGWLLGIFVLRCRDMRKKFQLICDYANDWEYWQETTGEFIYTSPSCEHITGYTPEEFTCDPTLLERIIVPEDLPKWKEHRHVKLSNGQVEPMEFRILTKDGETRWIHHICRNVYEKPGRKCGIRGSNRDITKIKKLQDEVRQLKGFLPICSACKKIRDDQGYWQQLEEYIREHSQAEFSHSICPDCVREIYPEYVGSNHGSNTNA